LGAVDATGTNPSVRTISFDVGSGGLTINGAISDNTTGSAIATGMIFTDVSSSDAGTTKLSGANTYRGGTTVSGGNLEILDAVSGSTSSSTGTGTVAENGGTTTTISGTGGTIGALTVTTGSRIAPGLNTSGTNKNFGGVGTLTFGGLTLTSANLDYDLISNAGSGNDMISTSSLAITTAGLTFNFSGTTLATGLAYELIAETGGSSATTLTGNVTSISTTFTGFSSSYTPTYSEDASGDLDVTFSSVPEPSTWAMLVIGFAFLGIWHRRRKGSLL
jgi:autotransporter-associated beta strand protein